MPKYLVKVDGSVKGRSGRKYYCNIGDEIEAPEGEFSTSFADLIPEKKKAVKRAGKKAETAAKEVKAEKRG